MFVCLTPRSSSSHGLVQGFDRSLSLFQFNLAWFAVGPGRLLKLNYILVINNFISPNVEITNFAGESS